LSLSCSGADWFDACRLFWLLSHGGDKLTVISWALMPCLSTSVLWWSSVDATFPFKLACDWQCGSQEQVSERMLNVIDQVRLVRSLLARAMWLLPPPSKVVFSGDLLKRLEDTW